MDREVARAQRMESAPMGKSGRTKSVTGIASVAAFDSTGRLLLGKRRDNGKWTLPGGHLELGESPADGAARELAEEAGIRGSSLSYLGSGNAGEYVIHAYRADDIRQTPSAANDPDDEIAEWAWVDVAHGLPERIRENLHAPKNVTLHLLGLGSADGLTAIESARQRMDRDPAPQTGCWDQVLLFGEYEHVTLDGKPVDTVFDASSCRAMLDDFAARKNDIFYDKQHEVVDETNAEGKPLDLDELDQWARGTTGQYGDAEGDGRALAWADALCMVVGGQMVKYVRHASAPENPPTLEDLRRSDGSLPQDGVLSRRSEVTPLGADPKEGLSVYRYTSPYFLPRFVKQRDGWRLLNLTVTNDPRMENVALAYERGARVAMQRIRSTKQRSAGRSAMENPMAHMPDMTEKMEDAPEGHAAVMAAAGCVEGDGPEVKLAKMTAYARKMEEAVNASAAARKAEDEPAAMEAEPKPSEDKEEDEAPAKSEAQKASRRGAEPSELQGLLKRMSALEEKNSMLVKELGESRSAMKRFSKMEAQGREVEAQTFARTAIAMGRVKGDHKGSLEATEKWLAAKWVKSTADAEDLLSAEGTYQISERLVMQRLTQGGAGIGAPALRGDLSPGDEVDGLISREIQSMQAAQQKGDLTALAMQRVAKKHPAAWARYANRNAV